MDMVRLTVVPDEGEAEILCRMLQEEGVRCAHRRTNIGSGGADASLSFGGWREVVVLERDLGRASALLPAGGDGSGVDPGTDAAD